MLEYLEFEGGSWVVWKSTLNLLLVLFAYNSHLEIIWKY